MTSHKYIKYDNMWGKCAFQRCRFNVKITDDILEKKTLCYGSSAFICELILIKLHTMLILTISRTSLQFMSKVKVTIPFITFSDCLVLSLMENPVSKHCIP